MQCHRGRRSFASVRTYYHINCNQIPIKACIYIEVNAQMLFETAGNKNDTLPGQFMTCDMAHLHTVKDQNSWHFFVLILS